MHNIRLFLYLNLYANILALFGLGVLALSFWFFNPYFFTAQTIVALVCFYFAGKIYAQWSMKKRLFLILVKRNRKEIRLDTLSPYAFTLCGRLVIKRTLIELGQKKQYKKIIEESPAYLESHTTSQVTINYDAFERLKKEANNQTSS